MSMISSYLISALRMPASRTTALPVAQASLLIMPSLLHISSLERGLEVFQRHGGKLFLGDLVGFVGIGVEEFQSLHHPFHEPADYLRLLLDRIETDVDGGISVGAELLGHIEERLAPDVLPDALRDHGLGGVADHRLSTANGGWNGRVWYLD